VGLLPYLQIMMKGPQSWIRDDTIQRALQIQDGLILNPKILAFQNREEQYPHKIMKKYLP
jgi:hypothetical protein